VAGGDVPKNVDALWSELYERYVEHVFSQRRASGAHDRERTIAALRWLARAMKRREVTDLWLERLQSDWLPHTGQRLLSLVFGVVGVSLVLMTINVAGAQMAARELLSGALLGVASMVGTFVMARGVRIRPREALRWRWQHALRRMPFTIGLGMLIGAAYGLFFVVWINTVLGAVGGFVAGLFAGLEGTDEESRVRPNQGILQSARNGVVLGLASFAIGVVCFGATARLIQPHAGPESLFARHPHAVVSIAISAAVFMGALGSMIQGWHAVMMHYGLRVALWLFSPLPWRLVPFLDHAVERALLRRVGGGYIFLHRTLLEYFAEEQSAEEQSAEEQSAEEQSAEEQSAKKPQSQKA
jgi:hypothetical protein